MSTTTILVKKLYFDIYNLEMQLENKKQIVREYQGLFDEYILNYKETDETFSRVYNEFEELNNKKVQKDFDRINSIEIPLIEDKDIDDDETRTLNKHSVSIIKSYRDIVKITHPDKTLHLDDTIRLQYEDYYKRATDSYDDNDLYGLLHIAQLLSIGLLNRDFTELDIDSLRETKKKFGDKLTDIDGTFIWKFMNIDNELILDEFISIHFMNILNRLKT